MSRRRFGQSLLLLLPPSFLPLLLSSGCGNSQTSGTQVQFSPEAKTQINDMREMYRTDKAQAKKKRK